MTSMSVGRVGADKVLSTRACHVFLRDVASVPIFDSHAGVAKSADARDLKSLGSYLPCGFKSRPRHRLTGLSQSLYGLDGNGFGNDARMGWGFMPPRSA